jgi:hypothetical protein
MKAEAEQIDEKTFGLPLQLFAKTRWEPYLSLADFETLKEEKSFLIGTSKYYFDCS